MKSREKTKEQLKEDLRNTRDELAIQKWGLEKTLGGMKVLVKELILKGKETGKAKAEDEAMLASIGDGIIATDPDRKIIIMNKVAEDLLGWKVNEAIGKLYDDIILLEDEKGNFVPPALKPLRQAFEKSVTTTTAAAGLYLISKNKNKFPVAITVSPIILDNKIIGAVEVFRDITKEKEIDRAKTEFVSLASHELRTPLTAIDGITAMIRDGEYGEVNSNLKQPLEDINTSSERLIHLVNNLLNLARMQSGRLKYGLSEIDIKPIAEGVISLLQVIAKPKGLRLSAADIDSVSVLADVDKLEQIFDNIIGNALKFTDKGNVTVSTKVAGDKVKVYISDTGIGIAKEDQVKLFGTFEQLGSSLGRPAGTGLGLHISRELVQKMGGDVWLERSEPGVGSTFAFSLPLAKSQLATKVKEEIKKEAKENPDQKAS